jgi:hypothetical protein
MGIDSMEKLGDGDGSLMITDRRLLKRREKRLGPSLFGNGEIGAVKCPPGSFD